MKSADAIMQVVVPALVADLMDMLAWNAASGYIIDPTYPPPEVFERPGWQYQMAPEGSWHMDVCEPDDMHPSWVMENPDVSLVLPIRTTTVAPLVYAQVLMAGPTGPESLRIGLGIHVPLRLYVVFRCYD